MTGQCRVCSAIANKKLVLFEDADVVAYLSPDAYSAAHIVVTTKKHYSELDSVPDYIMAWCYAIANKVSKLVMKGLAIQGLNFLINHDFTTKQHFTINILPRFQDDNLELGWTPKQASPEELSQVQKRYKTATNSEWVFETEEKAAKVARKQSNKIQGKDNYMIKQLFRLP